MRLSALLSRRLRSLEETRAVLKYFEQYGRVQEFGIFRVPLQSSILTKKDFYSGQRERLVKITYVDESAGLKVLKTKYHNIQLTAPPPSSSEGNTDVPSSTENRVRAQVNKSKLSLEEQIRFRVLNNLRTDTGAQIRVNKRMLRGFTGFGGELTNLWDRLVRTTREDLVKKIREDTIANERETERKGQDNKEQMMAEPNPPVQRKNAGTVELLGVAGKDIALFALDAQLEKVSEALDEIRADITRPIVETSLLDGESPAVGNIVSVEGTAGSTDDRINDKLAAVTTSLDSASFAVSEFRSEATRAFQHGNVGRQATIDVASLSRRLDGTAEVLSKLKAKLSDVLDPAGRVTMLGDRLKELETGITGLRARLAEYSSHSALGTGSIEDGKRV